MVKSQFCLSQVHKNILLWLLNSNVVACIVYHAVSLQLLLMMTTITRQEQVNPPRSKPPNVSSDLVNVFFLVQV